MISKNSTTEESILVLIDTAQDNHLALNRALATCKTCINKPTLHLYLCATAADFGKSEESINVILQTLETASIKYYLEYCDTQFKYEGILDCAKRLKPAIVMLPDNEEILLIRKAPPILRTFRKLESMPVMVLREGSSSFSQYGIDPENMLVSAARK